MKAILELVLDIGFQRAEGFAESITKEIQRSMSDSFRSLTALNFLAVVSAIAFVGLISGIYVSVKAAYGLGFGTSDLMILSAVVLLLAGVCYYLIDKRQRTFAFRKEKQSSQWIQVSKNILGVVKEFREQQKLENEIHDLREELANFRQDYKRAKEKETTRETQIHS